MFSETNVGGTGCGKPARPGLWGLWASNRPSLPGGISRRLVRQGLRSKDWRLVSGRGEPISVTAICQQHTGAIRQLLRHGCMNSSNRIDQMVRGQNRFAESRMQESRQRS